MPEVAGLWKLPDANKCRFAIWRAYKKGHPPPFAERQAPSTPIIFRTKNTAKSRLGLIGKIFGKNLWENISGGRESPQSCGKGGEVLKYERLVYVCKDSGIIR